MRVYDLHHKETIPVERWSRKPEVVSSILSEGKFFRVASLLTEAFPLKIAQKGHKISWFYQVYLFKCL